MVVDEAQDTSSHSFILLRQVIPGEQPNDLFIVGDGLQRIYRKKVMLGRAGTNIRRRSRSLRINYRSTDEIDASRSPCPKASPWTTSTMEPTPSRATAH